MILENIKIALTSMVHNKMRTLLSLLGIIIGVGSVVAILNLGQSVTESITGSMNIGGLDLVSITPSGSGRSNKTFDETFGIELEKNVDGIAGVTPILSSSGRIRSNKDIMGVSVSGVETNYFNIHGLELLYGNFFSAQDNINRRQVVVLGSEIAKELFPVGNAVGSYISLFRNQSKRYLVVGVLEEKDASLSGSYNNSIFIPFNTYSQRFIRVTGSVSSYSVKVEEGYDPTVIADQIKEYVEDLVGENKASVFSSASLVEMAGEVMNTLSSFLAAIAAISLLVGGIGIMNIMLVSVAERTREIGVRKALGASPKIIRAQFLVEAITLTLFGGIIGLLFGGFVSYAIVNIVGWNLYFSFSAVVISLGFSMLVGIFFGWYPAMKASKLDPIESLSYE